MFVALVSATTPEWYMTRTQEPHLHRHMAVDISKHEVWKTILSVECLLDDGFFVGCQPSNRSVSMAYEGLHNRSYNA